MARHPNPKRVKLHRTYTVGDAAACLRMHKNTIRSYLKNGLVPIDRKRPVLILGSVLRRFLEERRARGRQTCRAGQIYCIRCKTPKQPAGDIAEYIPMTATSGNLRAICPDCELLIHRRAALANIEAVMPGIAIIQQPAPRIEACERACRDCELKGLELP
jgi:hypothetical protein